MKNLNEYGFIGELSLDGRLRACRGILPMIIAGQKKGIKKIIVPEANLKEAGLVHGVEILGFHDLTGVIRCLEGKISGEEIPVNEVQNRIKTLNVQHIEYIIECLNRNTREIRKPDNYLLASLYNAPLTIGLYYKAQVQHDFKMENTVV